MTSSLSHVCEDREKHAPTRVMNALDETMIFHHHYHIWLFDTHAAVALRILLGRLEVEIASLATDLEMLARDFTARLAAAVAAFLATTHRTLPMRQSLLPSAIVAWILHQPTFGVGQEHLQAHIQAASRMRTCRLLRMCHALLILRRRLTHDQGIPLVVGAQHEMRCNGRSHQGTVQFDLEQPPEFGRHMQMLPVTI
jgi:hypothetical protein